MLLEMSPTCQGASTQILIKLFKISVLCLPEDYSLGIMFLNFLHQFAIS